MMDYRSRMEDQDTRNFASYLTWSDEDEGRLMVCTDVGQADVSCGAAYPPLRNGHPSAFRSVATGRTVNEYQLVYVTRGRGTFSSGEGDSRREWRVEPGSVLAVFPGVSHAYSPDPQAGWEERWVGFRGPTADALRSSGFHSPDRPFFQVGVHEALLSIFSELFSIVRLQEPYYQFRAGALILLLLSEILGRSRKAEQHDEASDLVERAKHLMKDRLRRPCSMEELGEELGVGRDRFYEMFRSYTGMTPLRYYTHLKVNEAKEMLSDQESSVKEVAFTLGFEDPYYFSRLFKKNTGVAPSEWASLRGASRDGESLGAKG